MKKTVEVLPFDTTQVTSCKNWSHPRYGDPCHPLASGQHPPCVVIEVKHESSKHGQWATAQYGDGRTGESSGLYARCQSNTNRRGREMADSVVRRLTPRECERLQGMPDDWSRYGINEKGAVYELPDSARYRLQGNGIATPFWKVLLKRISAQYERDPTMGSLFDGQGSFPMLWEGINGSGTCLWSSEIDKHAVAVAKYHFPEDTEDEP